LIASSIFAAAAEVIGRLPRIQLTPRSIAQPWDIRRVRVPPASMAFTVLLGFLVALPSFGIDMSLPALIATGASLGVAPAQAGLTMSLFMFGFAVAPLFYGPASDRYGRKPVVVFACTLFIIAGIGCAFARSLSTLLIWRVVQGAGAGASMTIALAIIRDLFEGQAARTRLSYVAIATMVVPMIAPTAGAALLALGGGSALAFAQPIFHVCAFA
jgi:DHA1 family bicyclomycin/chloramphenicol resistance-like MFS transporter